MADQTNDVQRILSSEDEEFRHWLEEHHTCETRLAELAQKQEISIDDEIEEKRLKKRKLFLKDQMAARVRGYQGSQAAHA
jgi:uncharacterized protein YdcH (DUF465 family)